MCNGGTKLRRAWGRLVLWVIQPALEVRDARLAAESEALHKALLATFGHPGATSLGRIIAGIEPESESGKLECKIDNVDCKPISVSRSGVPLSTTERESISTSERISKLLAAPDHLGEWKCDRRCARLRSRFPQHALRRRASK